MAGIWRRSSGTSRPSSSSSKRRLRRAGPPARSGRGARSRPRTAGRARAPPRHSARRARSRPPSWASRAKAAARLVLPIPGSPAVSTKRRPPRRGRARAHRAAAPARSHARRTDAHRSSRAAGGSGSSVRRRARPSARAPARGARAARPTGWSPSSSRSSTRSAVERLERLGLVAARGVRPHEQRVAGLAERGQLHELAGGELGAQRARRRPASSDGLRQQLERLEPLLLLRGAVLLEPGGVERRHQRALVDVERGLRGGAGQLRVARPAPRARRQRAARPGPRRPRASAGSSNRSSERPCTQLRAERPPQARQQRAERGRRVPRGAARPERVDELVARGRAVAVQDEVGQQSAPKAPWKSALEAAAAYLQSQLTAEVDPNR